MNTTKNRSGGTESATASIEKTAGQVAQTARSAASAAGDIASDTLSTSGRKADDAASSLGSGMKTLGSTIRSNAPREGTMHSAASHVARTLESGGDYLQEEGFTGMMDDLGGLIRRYPVPALLIGIGLGFCLAATCRR